MFIHVTNVRYLDHYRLELRFDDGYVGVVNLADELYGEVFAPLRELARFRQVYVNPETGTIEWPNGADFAPEFLYELGRESVKAA